MKARTYRGAVRAQAAATALITLFALLATVALPPNAALAAQGDCAQPVSAGPAPTATDALWVLRTAVGSQYCKRCVCDIDNSGGVSATDALATLNLAVGNPANLECLSCGPPVQLECEAMGYPCSLAETAPGAIERTDALMRALPAIRDAGTTADVRAFLESQTDVVEVFGDDNMIIFRVTGSIPAAFMDVSSTLTPSGSAISQASESDDAAVLGAVRAVVGEDSTNDGVRDQRDIKRALVLAPYEWEFAPFDESDLVATILGDLTPYQNRVRFRRNALMPPANSNGQITIDDYLNFMDYDVVYTSTHGTRACTPDGGGGQRCFVVIDTGTFWDWLDPTRPLFAIPGKIPLVAWSESTLSRFDLGLSLDFWKGWYNSNLDNQLVVWSACETGGTAGSELADAMGQDNFVMMGWTEVTDSDKAFPAATVLFEALVSGRTVLEGMGDVANVGLNPYVNSDGNLTTFQAFRPGGNHDLRIIEVPRLMLDGQVMTDGAELSSLVRVVSGSPGNDGLELTLRVDGVTPQTVGAFSIRYRIDGIDVPGSYDLSGATRLGAGSFTYEVVHQVDVGGRLGTGSFLLEAAAQLPEGGESSFSVNVTAVPCHFTMDVSGQAPSGLWDGAAHLIVSSDSSVEIALSSRGTLNLDLTDTVRASISTAPGVGLTPGQHTAARASYSFFQPPVGAIYFNESVFGSDFADFDCPGCGGSITFDTIDADVAVGSFRVSLPRTDGTPPAAPDVTISGEFRAVSGSVFSGTSAIVKCRVAWSPGS